MRFSPATTFGPMAIMLALLSMLLAGMAQALSTTSAYLPEPTLPANFITTCLTNQGRTGGDYYPDGQSLIRTTAAMMDWCGCENKVNPMGLQHAGMSAYDSGFIDPYRHDPNRQLARTWVCSANANASCDSEVDWYNALGNVSAVCGVNTTEGYFYDSHKQMAWGFGTYWDQKYCSNIGWVATTY